MFIPWWLLLLLGIAIFDVERKIISLQSRVYDLENSTLDEEGYDVEET